mgnify:CR=1 FL=1
MANPKIATLVPMSHLDLLEDDDYYLALSHVAAMEPFSQFYQQRAKQGSQIILDNAAIEMEEPESFETYLTKAIYLNVTTIMLPDYFQDVKRTMWSALQGMKMLNDNLLAFNVMAIPQGSTFSEWRECAIGMMVMLSTGLIRYRDRKIIIGISCRYTDMFGGSRGPAVKAIERFLNGLHLGSSPIRIHLLGCYADPRVEVAPLLNSPYVMGVDSSYPSVYAQHGLELTEKALGEPRPGRYINFETDRYDPALLARNIDVWRKACQSTEQLT